MMIKAVEADRCGLRRWTAPQTFSAETEKTVTGRSVKEHWGICLLEICADTYCVYRYS